MKELKLYNKKAHELSDLINKKEVNILSTLASDVLQKAANGLISMSKFISESKSSSDKKL